MRRVFVVLAVAGGLAALFATASRQPQTGPIVAERGYLIVSTNRSPCSIPNREMLGAPLGGPSTFYCHTHRGAERFQKRLNRRYAGLGAIARGTRVELP
jgi:hypothetical protein